MPVTIDGQTKTIQLDAETVTYTSEQIYSRWKEWVRRGDNSKWAAAFRVVGGDDLGDSVAPRFYFVRNDNGWSVARPEADLEVEILGNLVFEDPNGVSFSGPSGDFSPVIDVKLSNVATTDLQVILDALKAAVPDEMQVWLWRMYAAHFHERTLVNDQTTIFDDKGNDALFKFDHTQQQIKPQFDPEVLPPQVEE